MGDNNDDDDEEKEERRVYYSMAKSTNPPLTSIKWKSETQSYTLRAGFIRVKQKETRYTGHTHARKYN